jgi:hypothetical protein
VDDTRPSAARQQIAWMREAGPTRRFLAAQSLSRSVIELSRRALRRRNPGASDDELDLLFVELHYGADLARRMREHVVS